ncbi:Wadjet anti-phage system protein JetD domain-containing protein [Gluconacetobacter asukensis]|uniref:DUF2399 domain-containing protein n=1 Tax=Gluconacetobacter asukensis TaxID=1017181 RepID=A0A7W4J3L5_9PROT|nr:Wadjet anti-phage system protein JetD domain-containing protein [Gluconacetobacter asukensis]MBB2174061.1 DUF2399 domain-containing protein [Gluconacetobacter asukensis]
MKRRRFSTIPSLIDDLLARYERNPGASRLIAPIDDDGFANIDLRDAFDEDLATLEREGGIERIYAGPKTERVVTGVRLKNAEMLYRRSGRHPAGQMAIEAVSGLRGRDGWPDGAIHLIDKVAEAWGRGVSHIGIPIGDVRMLEHAIRLAIAVHDRMSGALQDEQDFRTFSRLAAGDSKALERNIRQVSTIFQQIFTADEEQVRLDPEELLGSVGVRRLPQPILLHGAVSLDGQPFPAIPYIGIPADCVGNVRLSAKPDYVLTIENFTSFVRHVREIAGRERALVIYSGGFPSRATRETIVRLGSEAHAPTFHWGDMDAGGVRIFRHLERHLDRCGVRLRPHLMDAELLRRVGSVAPANRPMGDLEGSAIAGLADLIVRTGLIHEQEEFDPQSPLMCKA